MFSSFFKLLHFYYVLFCVTVVTVTFCRLFANLSLFRMSCFGKFSISNMWFLLVSLGLIASFSFTMLSSYVKPNVAPFKLKNSEASNCHTNSKVICYFLHINFLQGNAVVPWNLLSVYGLLI